MGGNESTRRDVAQAGPAGHAGQQAESDQWRHMAESEVTGITALYGLDVESWAHWYRSLDQPLKGEVHQIMHERFGNSFVASVDLHIAEKQQEIERELTHDEIQNIAMTYAGSIDYSAVRIHFGGVYTDPGGEYARTVGNMIHMPMSYRQKDGSMSGDGLKHLYHEIGHVWQFQHAGWQYLPQALIAQLREGSDGSNEGEKGAYQWRDYAKAGTPLGEWNREAQAEMGAAYNIALHDIVESHKNGSTPMSWHIRDYTLALPYAIQLAQGHGATPDLNVKNIAKDVAVGPIGLLME